MELKTAKALLAFYPILYDYAMEQLEKRDNILHGYKSSLDITGRHATGGHSDITAAKAIAMADMSMAVKELNKVIDFMDTLSSWDKSLIINVWRCGRWTNWFFVANRMGTTLTKCRLAWDRLTTAFQDYAGHAKEPDGTAYAAGLIGRCLE